MNYRASPGCISDCTPGALSQWSEDFKMVSSMDLLWYLLRFHSLWLVKNVNKCNKPTYTVFPQAYERWEWKQFGKSKDLLNTVLSEDCRTSSLVTSILKAETVGKHFKNYIYINKQYYISSLIMYFMESTVIKRLMNLIFWNSWVVGQWWYDTLFPLE